jgi:acetyl-CoA acetyltransferase family protein
VDAYLVDAVRTPVGRFGGALAEVRVDDLAATCVRALLDRTDLDPSVVEEVVLGCVNVSGEAAGNLGRNVVLAAGLPVEVAGATVNRFCGSGLSAVNSTACAVAAGQAEVAIAGGAESMTRGTWIQTKPVGSAFPRGSLEARDGMMSGAAGPKHPRVIEAGWDLPMPATAANVARRYGITREAADAFALRSHQRAAAASGEGRFSSELVAVNGMTSDETIRDTTLEKLAGLAEIGADLPGITAGNSSSLNDGASAVLIASDSAVRRHQLAPAARILATAVSGCDPKVMGLGPAFAIPKALKRAGLTLDEIDLIEINEAFAAQVLGCLEELPIDSDRLNVNGGAIALGHALGNSGSRLLTTLVHELSRRNGRYGVASLCIGGGQGIATVIERTA